MSFDLFNQARTINLSGIEAEGVSRSSMKLVYLVMAAVANPVYFATVSTLAKETHLNKKAIHRALGALQRAKLIEDTGERLGKTRQIVVWKILTNRSESGTVPDREQYPIIPVSDPNCPGKRSQSGICNLRINQEINSSAAPTTAGAFFAVSRSSIEGK